MAGDCFQANSRLAEELDGTLCHGIVIGQPPIEGIPHVHAWVERLDEGSGIVLVHDNSNGKERIVSLPVYYTDGKIEPESVVRYTVRQMYRQQLAYEHYGPWAEHLMDHL